MATMYAAITNSPSTTLSSGITDSDTSIPVTDATKLPAAPNLATIGTSEDAETILYTGITDNTLTGVTREFNKSGTVGAKSAWDAGVTISRRFTAYDHDTFKANIEDIVAEISDQDWGLITGSAMSKQIQLRRGSTAQHSTFTGVVAEVTVDTDKKILIVHDGSTVGGIPLPRVTASSTAPTNPTINDIWIDISV